MKKIIAFAAVVLSVAMLSVLSASAALLGDADNDGKVKAGDARKILRHSARLEMETDEYLLKLMDVDGSGKIQATDARLALRMASRIDPTAEYVEPSTNEASDVPTIPSDVPTEPTIPSDVPTAPSDVPTEPTTEAPTTEEPVPPETTEEPATVPPTTEVPTSEEPTSEEPTSEEPTSEEPTSEEPTSEEPTSEPAPSQDNVVYHDNFYLDAELISYAGSRETRQKVKIASGSKTEEVKGLFNTKSYTLNSQFVRSDAVTPGKDIGILMKDELNTLKTGTEKTLYIIDYSANEYVSFKVSTLKTLAAVAGADFDVDEMFAGNPLDGMSIPTFTSLDGLNVAQGEYDGKTYQVVSVEKNGIVGKYYVEQKEDGVYYPVVAESYEGDKLVNTILINDFQLDPSPYLNAPEGMKGYAVNSVADLLDENVLRVFSSIGG